MTDELSAAFIPEHDKTEYTHGGALQENGFGLSLSGGGYKAAAYHLGGLIRLNELGMLRQIRRVASVSGGSITAGVLASRWKTLDWTDDKPDAVATNFLENVVNPLREFLTESNIDVPQGALGLLLPFHTAADGVADEYEKHLFPDVGLQDLPDAAPDLVPEFNFLTTSYQLNSLWRFSKAEAANYRIGKIFKPVFPLSRIVAASSAFPPFFCPLKLDFKGQSVVKTGLADKFEQPYLSSAELCDGGIYDNMGLEPIFKDFRHVLVSNAGDPFDETSTPPTDWAQMMLRIISMVHRQAENNRIRWLMELAGRGERSVGLWPLRATLDTYEKEANKRNKAASNLLLGKTRAAHDKVVDKLQHEKVRLWSLSESGFVNLVNYSYILADSALAIYFDKPLATKLPF